MVKYPPQKASDILNSGNKNGLTVRPFINKKPMRKVTGFSTGKITGPLQALSIERFNKNSSNNHISCFNDNEKGYFLNGMNQF